MPPVVLPSPPALAFPAEARLLAQVPAFHALQRPQAPALAWGDLRLSHAALAGRIDRAAAQLWHGLGVRRGDRVAWLGFNHPDQITLLFALARLGAMLVPLNFRLAGPEWQAVLDDCTPRCLLHDEAWADAARELAARRGIAAHGVQVLDDAAPAAAPPPEAAPESAVLLVYTSGTTGQPKGAVHTQANLLANMRIAAGVQRVTPADIVLTVLPLFHVGGLCIQTLPALLAGASVILHSRFDAGAALDCITRQRPTLTVQVPATLKALATHPQWAAADLSSLRAVWAGSSLLPAALLEVFHARGVPVCNVYGATETGPFSIALPPEQALTHVGSCGWPAPGVQARLRAVRRSAGVEAGEGVGEVLLRAPNVVARYWPDRPALDSDGWFHTGDLATQAADGSYTIVGRARDMIISGGENIYPAEVENALAAHAAVAECAVIGLPDARWGEVVAAAVVLRPGAQVSDEALLAHLAARIARYKQPRCLVRLNELPRTALGKVQKAELGAVLKDVLARALSPGAAAPPP